MSRHFKPHNKLFGTIPNLLFGYKCFQKERRKKENKGRKTAKEEKVKTYKYIISNRNMQIYKSRVENLRNIRKSKKFISVRF